MTISIDNPKTSRWKKRFEDWHRNNSCDDDGSHDVSHFRRVANMALEMVSNSQESVDSDILIAAAYFHDIVNLPKNHPNRALASTLSGKKADEILRSLSFPKDKLNAVSHAIAAHSFSAQIPPETLEAKYLQDADRMEALGAIGLMRTFYISGKLQRSCYDSKDPLAKHRPLDDSNYGLDHFEVKLLRLKDQMQTNAGKSMAQERVDTLIRFRKELVEEILKDQSGEKCQITEFFRLSGFKNGLLLHPTDPFANDRGLDPEKYALDAVTLKFPESWFLSEAKNELC
ncbi:MAG: hypothetical protein ACI9S8_002140 [Chlamydiales bacterium]|jgi:uncharacterized protein